MRRVLTLFLGLCAIALAAGFAGRFHGAGDTLAVARPVLVPLLALLSLTALVLRPRLPGVMGLALSLVAGYSMMPPAPVSNVPDDARVYSAYQKNLLWIIPDTAPVADDIGKLKPDFVMLQELHRRNRPILDRLSRSYPYQHFCPFAAVGGIAVLSRWPPTGAVNHCDGYGLAAMQVETPDGSLWIVSLHLHWPYPYGQGAQLDRLRPVLEALDGPLVLGGDFNSVPWSYAAERVKRATRTVTAGYAGGTFAPSYRREGRDLLKHAPTVPIDHVLVPDTGAPLSLSRRARFGSDHHGLAATFVMERL